jgi:hypothetical protein
MIEVIDPPEVLAELADIGTALVTRYTGERRPATD